MIGRRTFKRGPGGLASMCIVCEKHIRHHYGGTAYRCNPKLDEKDDPAWRVWHGDNLAVSVDAHVQCADAEKCPCACSTCTIMPEELPARDAELALRERYNAVLTERDALRSKVIALEEQIRELGACEVTRVICDECHTREVSTTNRKDLDGVAITLARATAEGWGIMARAEPGKTGPHLCPPCLGRFKDRIRP